MAPRLPETFEAFLRRLESAIDGGQTEIRYGRHHHSHAVCLEDKVFRVRRLEYTAEEAEAYQQQHGMFMPESAEAISKPRTLEFEATSLDALATRLREHWPS